MISQAYKLRSQGTQFTNNRYFYLHFTFHGHLICLPFEPKSYPPVAFSNVSLQNCFLLTKKRESHEITRLQEGFEEKYQIFFVKSAKAWEWHWVLCGNITSPMRRGSQFEPWFKPNAFNYLILFNRFHQKILKYFTDLSDQLLKSTLDKYY